MGKYPEWIEEARKGNYYADKIDVRPIMRLYERIAELEAMIEYHVEDKCRLNSAKTQTIVELREELFNTTADLETAEAQLDNAKLVQEMSKEWERKYFKQKKQLDAVRILCPYPAGDYESEVRVITEHAIQQALEPKESE